MKTGAIFFVLGATLLYGAAAWADRNPDFDQDAKPILRMQPHLLAYVEHNFDVRSTGLAKVPGDETRRPMPPFIFQARPHGSDGAYFITLLIQPGPEGRILKVVDPTHPAGRPPGPAGPAAPPPEEQPSMENPAAAPSQAPAPAGPSASTPSGPTSDTPSGPVGADSGGSSTLPPAPTNSSNLPPPPDPAPAAQ